MPGTQAQRVPAGNAVTWRVVSQQETSWVDAAGKVQTGWQIFFVVNTRTQGSVRIPIAEYTRQRVAAAVGRAAAEIAAVDNLAG